jgi:error-prone DNA polymerase
VNVICSVGVWARHRRVAQAASALLIRGTVESSHGVVNVMAERIRPLPLAAPSTSRDFC